MGQSIKLDNNIYWDSTGVADSSGRTLDELLGQESIQYWTLFNGIHGTTSGSNQDSYNSRKISDFNILIFVIKYGNFIRNSLIVPRTIFISETVGIPELWFQDANGVHYWFDIKYVSDTRVNVKCSNNGIDGAIYIYGIAGPSFSY